MLPEAVRDLSSFELLRALNEKLDLECTRLRETRPSPTTLAASVESEVSTSLTDAHTGECGDRI